MTLGTSLQFTTTPILLLVFASPICKFLEDRWSLTYIMSNMIQPILKGPSRCYCNTKNKAFFFLFFRKICQSCWYFICKASENLIWISNQFPSFTTIAKEKPFFFLCLSFNDNIKELRKTNFALGWLCQKTFHFKQGTTHRADKMRDLNAN